MEKDISRLINDLSCIEKTETRNSASTGDSFESTYKLLNTNSNTVDYANNKISKDKYFLDEIINKRKQKIDLDLVMIHTQGPDLKELATDVDLYNENVSRLKTDFQ